MEIPENRYIKIEDIPSARRKQIPKAFVLEVQEIPKGEGIEREKLSEPTLTFSTLQNRIKKLIASKKLKGNYKVIQRKQGDKLLVYVVNQ